MMFHVNLALYLMEINIFFPEDETDIFQMKYYKYDRVQMHSDYPYLVIL
jgi:hypothetical protein